MDPIGLAGGLNLYGYAGGDPINFGDPFGLCKVRVGWTATPVGMGTRHAFIEVTRPDNSRVFFRGGPTGASSSASSKNSADGYQSNADATSAETKNVSQNGQSVAGPIQAESQSPNDPGNDSQGALGYDAPLVDNDESCAKYERSFASSVSRINEAQIGYGLNRNSNSVVNTLLLRAGLGFLQPGGRRAPGAGSVLPIW